VKLSSMGIFRLVIELWGHISHRRKVQCELLLILTIFSSLSEIVSIGAIFPFLGALLNSEKIYENRHAQFFIEWFGVVSSVDLLLPLTIAFVLVIMAAGALRLLLIWSTTKISFSMGADIGYAVYQNTLSQEYRMHLDRNSSEVIDAIQNKTNTVIYLVLLPVLNLLSAFVLLILVFVALMLVNPLITFVTLIAFSAIYGIIIWSTKQRLMINGQRISVKSMEILKTLQEGLGSIRDILLDGNQDFYLKIFQKTDLQLRKAQASSTYIGAFPRNIMELFGIIILAIFAFSISKSNSGIAGAIPLLGVAALGAQRLLPILQQAYNAWTNIKVGKDSLLGVLEIIVKPSSLNNDASKSTQPIEFHWKIELRDLYFRYASDGPWVLNGINLQIRKGSRIGFMGKTGGGKSTLSDILMGLLEPAGGALIVDERLINKQNKTAWQKRIAHVPQTIYLIDGTIAENIAFGILPEEIDYKRVYEVASKAQILSFVNELPEKFRTHVGERGAKLSGGQRQRIGIARALYKKADVFIFDEATSSLDGPTESAVMDAIKLFDSELTILIIAHRLSTLKMCNEIYQLDEGVLTLRKNAM